MMTRRTSPASAALLLALLVPLTGCGPAESNLGMMAPPIRVAGWINGSSGSGGRLAGRVIVIDFTASW